MHDLSINLSYISVIYFISTQQFSHKQDDPFAVHVCGISARGKKKYAEQIVVANMAIETSIIIKADSSLGIK